MITHVDATVETRSQSRTTFVLGTGGKLTVPSSTVDSQLTEGTKAVLTIVPEQEAAFERQALAREALNQLLSNVQP